MNRIRKIICIGANCIAADITTTICIREKSPMDNVANFSISKSYTLFNKEIMKFFFKYKYSKRKSTDLEKKDFHFDDNVYTFRNGCSIVHNDFENKKYRHSLKKRLLLFKKYYKKSQKDDSLWYIYSLDYDDEFLTDIDLIKIYKTLPECCRRRLICIGIRGRNPLFEKYFNYYLDCGKEEDYKWHDKIQALSIIEQLELKYNLHFIIPEGIR